MSRMYWFQAIGRKAPLVKSRFARDGAWLGGAGFAATAIALLTTVVAARTLGSTTFGALALALAYTELIKRLVNFNVVQTMVRFGVPHLMNSNSQAFYRLVRFGVKLDAITAGIAATVAVAGIPFILNFLQVGAGHAAPFWILSVAILADCSSAANGALRARKAFGSVAVAQVVASSIRLAAVLVVTSLEATLAGFAGAWAAGEIARTMAYWGLLYRTRKEYAPKDIDVDDFAPKLTRRESSEALRVENPGILRFTWVTNAHASLKLALNDVDVIIVGAIVGSAPAGFLRLIRQGGGVLTMIGGPLGEVAYPRMTRAVDNQNYTKLKRLILYPGAVGLAIGAFAVVTFATIGTWLVATVLGADYSAMYFPAVVYLVAIMIALAGVCFQPAALSLSLAGRTLQLLLICIVVYLILLTVMTKHFGLTGATIAYLVFYLQWAAMMWVLIRRRVSL